MRERRSFLWVINLVLLMVVCTTKSYAQISLTADAPRVVEVGENFRVVFTINAKPDNPNSFTLPAIGDFDVLAGPSTSRMNSTQIINGKRTDTEQYSYTYILLPTKEGQFTIPSVSVTVNGKSYSSSPIKIEVVKGGAAGDAAGQKKEESGTISSDDIFLKLSVNKSNVVIGERLIATIKLYTRVPIAGLEDIRFPSFNGFWSQELESPQNIEFVRESVGGKIYDAALIRRYLLLPQQSGTIIIDGAELQCQIQVRQESGGSRSLFDSFFDSYRTVRKRVPAAAVKIVANPLPKGAPSSFGGGVGSFNISSRLSRDSVNANDALSYFIEISGVGNINLIEPPKVEFPSSFELYDTKITDGTQKANIDAHGSKLFEYPLIARAPGEYIIPKFEFSYYDIDQKRYITILTEEHKVIVGNSTSTDPSGTTSITNVNKQSVKNIRDDIRYISTYFGSLKKGNLFFVASTLYFVAVLLIFALVTAFAKYLSTKIKRERDVAGRRNRKANKIAKTRLKRAGSLLNNSDSSLFYKELHTALLGYVSDKLNLTISDSSKENISASLYSKGVNDKHVEELLLLLDECEYARYAPDPTGVGKENNYKKAMELISSMEL